QSLAVVAGAVADVAGDIDVGEEVHLDLDQAVALARLAPAALDVEAEAAGLVAARLALGQAGEPVADLGEGAGDRAEVVRGGAVDGELLARALAAGRAERDLAAAGEIIGGEAAGAGE